MIALVTRAGEFVNRIVVATLDEAQAAYPDCDVVEETDEFAAPAARVVTKLGFRRRFTLEERVAIDAAPENPAIAAETRSVLRTLATDLALAEEIDLDDPATVAGLALLEQLGIIAAGRAAEIRQ